MATYALRALARKPFRLAESQLDLFRDGVPATPDPIPPTPAERAIARRFAVSLPLARTLAELANLGERA